MELKEALRKETTNTDHPEATRRLFANALAEVEAASTLQATFNKAHNLDVQLRNDVTDALKAGVGYIFIISILESLKIEMYNTMVKVERHQSSQAATNIIIHVGTLPVHLKK